MIAERITPTQTTDDLGLMTGDQSQKSVTRQPSPGNPLGPRHLVPVATGHSTNGQPYAVTVAPDYVAYQERMTGKVLYRRCEPIETCENDDQRTGWREEEEWYTGQAQYLRALQEENCPPEWADPYVSRPLGWEPPF